MKKILLFLSLISCITFSKENKYTYESSYSNKDKNIQVKIRGEIAEISINNGEVIKLFKKESASGNVYSNLKKEISLKDNFMLFDENGNSEILRKDENKYYHSSFEAVYTNNKIDVKVNINNENATIIIDNKKLDAFYKKKNSENEYTNGILDVVIKENELLIIEDNVTKSYMLKSFKEQTENFNHSYTAKFKNGKKILEIDVNNDSVSLSIDGIKYTNFKRTISASGEVFTDGEREIILKGKKAYFLNEEYKRIYFVEKEIFNSKQKQNF